MVTRISQETSTSRHVRFTIFFLALRNHSVLSHHSVGKTKVVERDLLLQEKEKLYKEMKDILARQVCDGACDKSSFLTCSIIIV